MNSMLPENFVIIKIGKLHQGESCALPATKSMVEAIQKAQEQNIPIFLSHTVKDQIHHVPVLDVIAEVTGNEFGNPQAILRVFLETTSSPADPHEILE